jgi:hypothetical protein
LIPEGVLVTVPLPLLATESVTELRAKFAVQVLFASMVTEPLQPVPDQPANLDPKAGAAVKLTAVPLLNVAEQLLPQLMPAGLLMTVPLPLPALARVKVKVLRLNVAVQVVLVFIVTEPLLQPVPDQPANVDPKAGVAVKVTAVPLLNVAEQVLPQLMLAGLLVTVPLPLPALATVRVKLEVFETVTVTLCTAVELSLYTARTVN